MVTPAAAHFGETFSGLVFNRTASEKTALWKVKSELADIVLFTNSIDDGADYSSVCLFVCTKSVFAGRAIEAGRSSSFRVEGGTTLTTLPPIVIGAPCPLAVYSISTAMSMSQYLYNGRRSIKTEL